MGTIIWVSVAVFGARVPEGAPIRSPTLPVAAERAPVEAPDEAPAPQPDGPQPITPAPAEARCLDLLNRLAARSPEIVRKGIVATARLGNVLFDLPLRRILAGDDNSDDADLRQHAATALGLLDWPPTSRDLEERIAALDAAASDDFPGVRAAAIAALGEYATVTASRAVRRGRHVELEPAARRDALERMRHPEVVARLVAWLGRADTTGSIMPARWQLAAAAHDILTDPRQFNIDEQLAILLRAEEPASVRRVVLYALKYGNTLVQRTALQALRNEPLEGDLPALLVHLTAADNGVRGYAARAIGVHKSPVVVELLTERLEVERDEWVQKYVALGLRQQRGDALFAALIPIIRGGPGLRRRLAMILVRERTGRTALWSQVVAHAVDPTDKSRDQLLGADAADRRAVLLPRLAPERFARLPRSEQGAILLGLSDIHELEVTTALVALLTPDTNDASGVLIADLRQALEPRPDSIVVPHLEALLALSDDALVEREAIYEMLLARESVQNGPRLAVALARETSTSIRHFLLREAVAYDDPDLLAQAAAQLDDLGEQVLLAAALEALDGVADPTLAARFGAVARRYGRKPVGARAFELLEELPGPAAIQQILSLAQDKNLDADARAHAIAALGDLGSEHELESTLGSLGEMLDAEEDSAMRTAIRNTMHVIAPDSYQEWDSWGRYPLVAAAAGFGANLFAQTAIAAGEMNNDVDDMRTAALGIGGGILGGATAFLFTLNTDISLGEAGYFSTVGLWGTLGGYGLARATGLSQTPSATAWSTLVGQGLGLAVGGLTLRYAKFTGKDVLLSNMVATTMGIGAVGIQQLASRGRADKSGADNAFFLGGVVGLAPMLALSRFVDMNANTWLGAGAGAAVGSWLGAFAPHTFLDARSNPTVEDTLAGFAIGQAVGFAGGLALGATTELDGGGLGWGTVGLLTGAAAGAGAGLVAGADDRRISFALLESGTLLGAGLLTYLGPKLVWGERDAALVAMMAGTGAVAGGLLPAIQLNGEKIIGGTMLGGSIGLYAGLATSQFVDLTLGELAMTGVGASMLALGAGGLALMLPPSDLDYGKLSPVASIGAIAGMVGMAFLSPHLRYETGDIVLGTTTSALGLALGALMPEYWDDPANRTGSPASEHVGGAMVGAAAGLIAAGAISQATEITWQRALDANLGAIGGAIMGTGLGLLVPGFDNRATVGLAQAGTTIAYGTALFLTSLGDSGDVATSFDSTGLDWDNTLHATLGFGAGAWHGWLIPYLWRKQRTPNEDVPAQEIAGGLMLGASSGALALRLIAQVTEHDRTDIGETALFDLLGSSVGGGLALMLDGSDRRLRFGLLGGAGLAAFVLGEIVSPYTEYDDLDRWQVAALVAEGAVGGIGLPFFGSGSPSEQQLGGGALLGAGAGGLLGIGLTQVRQSAKEDIGESFVTSNLGAIAGLGLAGAFRDPSTRHLVVGTEIGWLAGMALGLGFAPYTEYTSNDLALIAAGSAIGGWVGGLMPRLIDGRGAVSEQHLGGVAAGMSLGLLSVGAVAQAVEIDPYATLEASIVATAATLAAGGFGRLGWTDGPRKQSAVQMATALGGFGIGLGVSYLGDASPEDAMLVGTGAVLGAWHGAFLPAALGDLREPAATGALMAGAGLTALAGYAVGKFVDVDPSHDLEMLAASSIGSMVGAGAGLMLGAGWQESAVGLEVGSLIGAGLGIGLGHLTDYDNAVPLLTTGALAGAWNGAWLGAALSGRGDNLGKQIGGGALFGTGVGLAASMVASQLIDVDQIAAFEGAAMMAAGNLIGGGAAMLAGARDRHAFGLVAGLGTAGLLAGLGTSGIVDYENAAPVITLAALGGAWNGAWLGATVSGETPGKQIGGGAMLGLGASLMSSMIVSQLVDFTTVDAFEAAAMMGAGNLIGGGAGLLAGIDDHATFGLVAGLGTAGLLAGLGFSSLVDYEDSATALTTIGLGGAWNGAWLGAALSGRGDNLGKQIGGGAMLGLGAGLLTSMVASQLVHLEIEEAAEALVMMAAGNLIGGGIGLLGAGIATDLTGLGLVAGLGTAGLAAGLVTAGFTDYEGSDYGLIAMMAGIGTAHGAMFAAAVDGDAVSGRMGEVGGGGAVLGAGLGILGGMLLAQKLQLSGLDILEIGMTAAIGDAIGVGIGTWARQGGAPLVGIIELGGIGLTAVGLLAAEATDFNGPDRLLTLYGGMLGGWMGGWIPALWNANRDGLTNTTSHDEDYPAGMVLGIGAGLLGAGIASQFLEVEYDDIGEVMFGSLASNMLGAGLGLVINHKDPRLAVGLMEATGAVGTVAVAMLADRTSYDAGDAYLGAITGLYGAYQGFALELLGDEQASPEQLIGAMMLGTSIGTLGGMYLGQYLELDATDTWMLAAGGAWGVWLGVWATAAFHDQADTDMALKKGLGYTAIATDVGLMVMSLGISHLVDLEPLRFAWISIGGGTGALLGLATAGIANLDLRHGLLWGTVGGLVGVTVLTAFVDLPGMGMPDEDEPKPNTVGTSPPTTGSVNALLPEIDNWFPSVQVTPAGAQEGLHTGGTEYMFTISGMFR